MINFMVLLFQNSIMLSLALFMIVLSQKTILAYHMNISKVMWIILIVCGNCIVKPYSIDCAIASDSSTDGIRDVMDVSNNVSVSFVMFILWIVVAMIVFMLGIIRHRGALRAFDDMECYEDNIYLCKYERIAFTHGFINYKIIISENIVDEDREFILDHEHQHVNGKDNLIKLLYFTMCCMYWFNPLVWLGRKHLEYCLELACDERAIKNYNNKRKARYMRCLARFCGVYDDTVASLGFGKIRGEVSGRVQNIVEGRKLNIIKKLLAAAMFVSMMLVTFVSVRFNVDDLAGYDVGEYYDGGINQETYVYVDVDTDIFHRDGGLWEYHLLD